MNKPAGHPHLTTVLVKLAALMMVSAQTWAELPPQTRPDFVRELALNHRLTLTTPDPPLSSESTSRLPYLHFLIDSLTRRSGQTINVYLTGSTNGSQWIWTDIPVNERQIRFGTEEIGRGVTPAPLPENGPTELVMLTHTFNHMALQVREFLADDNPEAIDLRDIIDRCVIDARRTHAIIDWSPGDPCVLSLQPLVLARILTNLLQNAVRYGEGRGITVKYGLGPDACAIKVLDRGSALTR